MSEWILMSCQPHKVISGVRATNHTTFSMVIFRNPVTMQSTSKTHLTCHDGETKIIWVWFCPVYSHPALGFSFVHCWLYSHIPTHPSLARSKAAVCAVLRQQNVSSFFSIVHPHVLGDSEREVGVQLQ